MPDTAQWETFNMLFFSSLFSLIIKEIIGRKIRSQSWISLEILH